METKKKLSAYDMLTLVKLKLFLPKLKSCPNQPSSLGPLSFFVGKGALAVGDVVRGTELLVLDPGRGMRDLTLPKWTI